MVRVRLRVMTVVIKLEIVSLMVKTMAHIYVKSVATYDIRYGFDLQCVMN